MNHYLKYSSGSFQVSLKLGVVVAPYLVLVLGRPMQEEWRCEALRTPQKDSAWKCGAKGCVYVWCHA